MKKFLVPLIFLFPLLWSGSCKEESSEVDYNPNVLTAKDYIRAEDAIFEIVNAFFKGVHDSLVLENSYGFIDYCDVLYVPSEDLMRFGYGEVNRMCPDNKFRRGLFRAYFSGPVFEEGVNANLVTDSLFVDNVMVQANLDIQNLGLNTDNIPEYSLKINSSLVMLTDTTKTNGVSITADLTLLWTNGSSTPEIHEDDTYYASGTAEGVSADGTAFSIEIIEPLKDYVDCFWISQGFSLLTVPSAEYPTGDIDYILEDACNNEMHFYFNENLFFDVIK